jgi:hypothetical protein
VTFAKSGQVKSECRVREVALVLTRRRDRHLGRGVNPRPQSHWVRKLQPDVLSACADNRPTLGRGARRSGAHGVKDHASWQFSVYS